MYFEDNNYHAPPFWPLPSPLHLGSLGPYTSSRSGVACTSTSEFLVHPLARIMQDTLLSRNGVFQTHSNPQQHILTMPPIVYANSVREHHAQLVENRKRAKEGNPPAFTGGAHDVVHVIRHAVPRLHKRNVSDPSSVIPPSKEKRASAAYEKQVRFAGSTTCIQQPDKRSALVRSTSVPPSVKRWSSGNLLDGPVKHHYDGSIAFTPEVTDARIEFLRASIGYCQDYCKCNIVPIPALCLEAQVPILVLQSQITRQWAMDQEQRIRDESSVTIIVEKSICELARITAVHKHVTLYGFVVTLI